ncbi:MULTISPECIES: hypothetical protein [Bosea]|uniref:hypothetical protein n=1 Tax=Bosea TaxID=85413 RepID=UPI00214FADE9|nr:MULTISPECIES: hypothetical protein [Bosea]MCR4520975.1 hypothetical protein [Bosea sp. 47.2.35]MDR6830620.1 cytochrome P450 [Bosea robiniae]MDR6897501.1 cytochrome P450 [Bosea sp. BE109]MDR7140898.1 cytochrome P450 [Bosea sp. BE168]MDR7177582.1 cytochrome P450 [Bosea sp. BE271]
MALNPILRQIVARAADRGRRIMVRRDVARELMIDAIAEEIYSVTPDDADLDVLALADTIVDRLEAMGVELLKPRLSVRAATQRAA